MEPMLATGHDGQISMVLLGKCRYCFNRCQIVMLTVENTGGDIPDDRMLPHITKVIPRQRFSEIRGDFPFLGKLLFGHIRPLHHIASQVLHIHDWGDEISPVNQCFIQRGQCEESPDAVGNQGEVLTPASLLGEKCEKLFLCLPWRLRTVIKPDYLVTRKECFVMLGFPSRAAFSVNIYY